jgi:hypothetical protein
MPNCYSCERELEPGEGQVFSEYGGATNDLVCGECVKDYEPCYVCGVLCDPGSNESGQCDSCQRYFHIGCDRGWHSTREDFMCSACGRKRGLEVW